MEKTLKSKSSYMGKSLHGKKLTKRILPLKKLFVNFVHVDPCGCPLELFAASVGSCSVDFSPQSCLVY